ncbi:hypothetical protein [Nocardia mexicana]|uniref:DUF8176 domain-containing protein n=1 Tax=Nocardia mexicana TaxID=279262 RepID=A0A370HFB0_9NOCA|nr:hypothetical protein [Nocardia mexicana]RDI55476.1 hypothetical protein DFR68_101309 [Nocardia mexicana]
MYRNESRTEDRSEAGPRESFRDEFDNLLRPEARGSRKWWLVPVGVFVALLVTVTVLVRIGQNTDSGAPPAAAPAPPVASQCPTERDGDRVQGNGPGGTDSAAAAILAFQHAFYVERSGDRARAVVAADGEVSPAAVLQQGIDSIPPGATHCVTITPTAIPGENLVTVTEFRPGHAAQTYNSQLVTTRHIGDRYLITAISPRPRTDPDAPR